MISSQVIIQFALIVIYSTLYYATSENSKMKKKPWSLFLSTFLSLQRIGRKSCVEEAWSRVPKGMCRGDIWVLLFIALLLIIIDKLFSLPNCFPIFFQLLVLLIFLLLYIIKYSPNKCLWKNFYVQVTFWVLTMTQSDCPSELTMCWLRRLSHEQLTPKQIKWWSI